MGTRHQIAQIRKFEIRKTQYGMMVPIMLLLILLLVAVFGNHLIARAQGGGTGGNSEYFSTRTIVRDGKSLTAMTIKGPPTPPAGYELQRSAVDLPGSNRAAASTLTVPAFDWVFGCSSVSGAMIAGYYDRNGFPNMYTGPTNGGVTPLDNSMWGSWSDGVDTYNNIPLAASHNGVDGRTIKGSIDDYWIQYGNSTSDPYITGSWTEHTWGDAIGDYMKTSQSTYGNTDGSTTFWGYTTSASPLTCADMYSGGIGTTDGTYGRKLFYEARGYTVTDCYSQKTDNTVAGGFSYAQFKAEIDAGRPVMLNLAGHTIAGVGYSDPNTIVVHDTWNLSNHSVTWGADYAGMQLLSVSIVNLANPGPTGFNSSFNGSLAGWSPVKGAWGIASGMYYRSIGIANKGASAKHATIYENFTYYAKMKRSGTCTSCPNRIIIRGKPGSLDSIYLWKPSYLFQYTNSGSFSVFKLTSTGYSVALKPWTASSFIVKNGWNTLKVYANGTSLKYYINGHLVWSGTDPLLKTGQVGLGFFRDSFAGTLLVDWAHLEVLSPDENPFEFEEVAPGLELQGGTIDMAP